MGNLQKNFFFFFKKRRATGKKSLEYRGKSGQNTGNDFIALGLGVVLYLPNSKVTPGGRPQSDPKVTQK